MKLKVRHIKMEELPSLKALSFIYFELKTSLFYCMRNALQELRWVIERESDNTQALAMECLLE